MDRTSIAQSMRQRERQKKRKKAGIRRANAVFLKSYYARNKKTLFQACKTVFFGSLFIAAGLAMTVLGYFNRELATSIVYNSTSHSEVSEINDNKRVIFKGMQYVGPMCMGFGAFAMIIACVMTLESRDRHAQIIQEESSEYRKLKNLPEREATKTSLLSPFEENIEVIDESAADEKQNLKNVKISKTSSSSSRPNGHTVIEKCPSLPMSSPHDHSMNSSLLSSTSPMELSVHRFLNVNIRKPKGPAPIAEADSFLDLTIQKPNGYQTSQKRSSVRSLVESSD